MSSIFYLGMFILFILNKQKIIKNRQKDLSPNADYSYLLRFLSLEKCANFSSLADLNEESIDSKSVDCFLGRGE